MRLYEYIQQGGSIMYLLVFLNIVGFTIMITKFLALNKHQSDSDDLAQKIGDKIKEGASGKDPNTVIEIAKQELSVYISGLEKGLNTVKIIASIAPLLGLLGTVIGVLLAFQVMAKQGLSDPSFFAQGISLALVTTVGGMIVAIPHFVGHNYLIGMLDRLESKLEKDIINKVL